MNIEIIEAIILLIKDKELINVSTCTFDDIKSFYQDTYEALASLLFIPVCLDNIDINCRYFLGGVFICYLANRIIDSRYVFESTIDINTKILKFNIMPIKAD